MGDDLRYTIGLDTGGAQRSLRDLLGGVGDLGAALGGLGVAAGFTALLKRGLDFNKTMADSEVAIGNVLQQMAGLNAEAAKAEAAKAMQQLIALEPKAAGSLTDLVGGFMATLGASQSAGISISENIDLVGRFANALANSAIPAQQLAQEMRSIVTGNIGADSSLAKVLNISNEDINKARAAGNLYQFLIGKIGKLGEAGDTAAVAFSSLSSQVDKVAGALSKELFEASVQGAKDLTAALAAAEPAFVALGQAGGAAFGLIGQAIGQLAPAIQGTIGLTRDMVDHIYAAYAALQTLQGGGSVDKALEMGQAALNALRMGREMRDALKGIGDAAAQAGNAGAAGMQKLGAAAQAAAQQMQGEGLRGDKDGDGIISKREQRKLDLEDKRAQRKADSIKGFSGKRLGLDLGFGGLDAAGLEGAINLYFKEDGKGEGKKAFSNLFDIGGTAGLKKLRAGGGDVVQGALSRLRSGEDVTWGLGATGAFALPKAAVNANLKAADAKNKPADQGEVITKLEDIKTELSRIRTS